MGFNSTIVICNDQLSSIKEDKDFGKHVYESVLALSYGKPVDMRHGAQAIETHHADGTSLIAVGGNQGTELGTYYYVGDIATDSGKLNLLKQLADQLGYDVSKKKTIRSNMVFVNRKRQA